MSGTTWWIALPITRSSGQRNRRINPAAKSERFAATAQFSMRFQEGQGNLLRPNVLNVVLPACVGTSSSEGIGIVKPIRIFRLSRAIIGK